MSMIEELREAIIDVVGDDSIDVSIGRVNSGNDVIRISQTGGNYEKFETYTIKNKYYEMKFQLLIYIQDLKKAYNTVENIEQKMTTYKKTVNKYNFSNFRKVSGPIDLAFDSENRKVISINYTCCVENLEI